MALRPTSRGGGGNYKKNIMRRENQGRLKAAELKVQGLGGGGKKLRRGLNPESLPSRGGNQGGGGFRPFEIVSRVPPIRKSGKETSSRSGGFGRGWGGGDYKFIHARGRGFVMNVGKGLVNGKN